MREPDSLHRIVWEEWACENAKRADRLARAVRHMISCEHLNSHHWQEVKMALVDYEDEIG